MKLTAYPIPTKGKSVQLCSAFVHAARGEVALDGRLRPGTVAVFYGLGTSNLRVWQAVRAAGLPFVYLDNAVFDAARGSHFRATLNALQHSGEGASDGKRFAQLGVPIEPWRSGGRYALLCHQSPLYMRHVVQYLGDWPAHALKATQGKAPAVRVRPWSPDKPRQAASLRADLLGASVLVTYSSATAVQALLAGVPVVVSQDSAAARLTSTSLDRPCKPGHEERRRWASVLADNEFTIDELRSGFAWGVLRNAEMVV